MQQESIEYIDGYRSSYKYYFNGNVNIILSAPHGGSLTPDDVPDRTDGVYVRSSDEKDTEERCRTTVVKDSRTDEFTENVANELKTKWNVKPFIIIAKWHRKKVDFNREILEGTLNNPEAVSAYQNYHMSLTHAVNKVNQLFGKGLLIDIHGHSQGK
jgi:N-formylglutamate amidohydrolase